MIGTETAPSASRTQTFLFADLEGSTGLWQQFPEAMKTTLARHDEVVRGAKAVLDEWRG